MAFVHREFQAPTNQPRQSCQGSQRLGYHLFGSSTGTCWLVCGSASKWKRFMWFHPIFTHGSYEKSSCLTVFLYSRFAKSTLGWWFFVCIPDTIPLGFWNLFGTFCDPPGNCPRSNFWVDDFPAFAFGGIWTRKQNSKRKMSLGFEPRVTEPSWKKLYLWK